MKRGGFIQRHQSFQLKPQHPRVRAALRRMSDSPSAVAKRNIQDLLRELAILRDGGCVLRHYPEAGACSGYRQDGELILQAEHLVTRSNSVSYGDMRNIVCLCRHHHGHWKPEHSLRYWQLIERHIGPERWAWLQRVLDDHKTYPFRVGDWKAIEIALCAELKNAVCSEPILQATGY
jgi:hypothetical protein